MATIDLLTAVQELRYLGLKRVIPSPTLAPWVECFWSVKASLPQAQQEYLYPDGGSSLLFVFAGNDDPGVWFNAKQQQQGVMFEGHVSSVGIRFKPGGAFALLGMPMADLTGQYIEADLLPLVGLETLSAQLQQATFYQQVALLETWLHKNAAIHSPVTGPVQYLTQQLNFAEIALRQLIEDAGLGRRRVERLFKQQVGLSPNRLKMLQRIKTARYLIKNQPDSLLVDIALQTGFFDQAHFSHQFRRVTGYTPGEYQQKQRNRLLNNELVIQKSKAG